MTITKTIIIDVDADQANKDLEKFDDNIEETTESTNEMGGALDSMTGGAVAGFSAMLGGIKKTIIGFKSLKVAIAATGIGLLVVGILAVKTAFTASEEGQNKFAKLMGQIAVVTGNVIDIFADLGESILAAGKALVRLAKGDLKGASLAWGEFKDNINEVTEAVKNFGEETRKELESALNIADQLAKADIIDRDLITERAKATRDIAELRLKSEQKDKFDVQERIRFLTEANAIEEEITNKAIESARIRAEAKTLENSLSKSTKEDLQEEEQLKANIINLETQRLNLSKRLATRLIEFRNEELAALKAIEDQRIKQIADEEKEAEESIDREIEREQNKADALLTIEINAGIKKSQELQKQADETSKLAEGQSNVAVGFATQTSNLVGQIVNEDSKLAKGVAVASATISGFESVQNAFTTAQKSPITALNPAYPFIQAGLAGAFSLVQLSKIKSADPSKASGGGSTGGGTSAPSFNLVAGTGTNQIAEGLQPALEPVKAFVVSSDVSTSQELDRKIVEGASL